jgi:hypothetical protein
MLKILSGFTIKNEWIFQDPGTSPLTCITAGIKMKKSIWEGHCSHIWSLHSHITDSRYVRLHSATCTGELMDSLDLPGAFLYAVMERKVIFKIMEKPTSRTHKSET